MRPWAGSWRWITLVLLAWGTLLFYIGGHLVRDSEHPERSSRELSKILAKLERLKQQNEDLRRMAESLRIPEGQAEAGSLAAGRLRSLEDQLTRAKQKIHSFQKLTGDAPGPTQEELRRKVENGIKEFWYFVRSEVKKLSNVEPSERQKYADTLLQDLGHQERSIMTDLYYLSQADGVGEWRMKEAKDLSDLVQNRITYLQGIQRTGNTGIFIWKSMLLSKKNQVGSAEGCSGQTKTTHLGLPRALVLNFSKHTMH
ncbi:Alpha-(1,6)-fucosyltransferase [Ameca splendens]|uniref:Alpha-(1,6)-fucosyltransferase n=1 Tax=Ameca splendens TaxID=208324 RepID=A0ABV0ZXS3_9TELE